MATDTKQLLTAILDDWETAYREYLATEGVLDTPMAKGAYYAGVELLITWDPLDDSELQNELLEHIRHLKVKYLQHRLEVIEMLFLEVNKRRMDSVSIDK